MKHPTKNKQKEMDEKAVREKKAIGFNGPGGEYSSSISDRIGRHSIMGELKDHNRDGEKP